MLDFNNVILAGNLNKKQWRRQAPIYFFLGGGGAIVGHKIK